MHHNACSPAYGFLKNPSMVDFPKHLAAVFFTSGCNFTCGFCHNASLMARKQKGITWGRLSEACRRFKQEWVNGAVITGGEPTLEKDLIPLIEFLRGQGFDVKLDTNGSMPEVVEQVLPMVDYIAMDIKAGPDGYPELVGYNKIDRIERSIALIKASAKDYEFRTTIIENFHDEHQMRGIGELVQGARRYIIQPFLPNEELPDEEMRTLTRTSAGTMEKLNQLMQPYAETVVMRGA